MEVNLEIIGCGDAFGSGGNNHTCFYLRTDRLQILIDCGATSGPALKKHHIDISSLDYVLVSHLHGDHFGGLPFLLLDSLQTPRVKPLQIVGPPGIKERTRQLFDLLYPGSAKNLDEEMFIYTTYTSEQVLKTDCFSLEVFPVIHTEQAMPHGLKLTLQGKVVSYSGDTSWCDNLIAIAKNADLFICECTFYNHEGKGHLNYHTIMQHRPELDCEMLLLTHLDQEMLDAADKVEVPCAYDGMKLTI
ncbi:MBL fold metallo-hydrolase [Pedobacter sp.]|uniref:MBL fold metallo-hydrolase n=1 Tax=Pedobacter sp. TaxID=1411316 RepID=UPI003D7F8457